MSGVFVLTSEQIPSSIYTCQNGNVKFLSDAPLEMIKAESSKLSGVLNLSDRSFTFSLPIKSFEGFNSSLQRVHFNEDYMESELYPNSTFKGKIIEEIDLSKLGKYQVRAKGKINIHGVENDRIIKVSLVVGSSKMDANAEFTVFLEDYNITIPSIVNQKIAEEIKVSINLTLVPLKK